MSASDHLHALATIVDGLEERGVAVTVVDVDDYDHKDELDVGVRLEVPAELPTAETADGPSQPPQQYALDDPLETEGDDQDAYTCEDCDYETDTERGLNIHRGRVHDGEEADGGEAEPDTDADMGGVSEAPELESTVGFDDAAPDWLDEHSWHDAVAMSESVDELAETLGWDDREQLQELLEATDSADEVAHTPEVND